MERANLNEWVNEFTQDLYNWAVYKLSDAELAKDIVQDTFLAAAEKMDAFKGESAPKTWLFSILNNKIVDVYRKRVRQPVKREGEVFSRFFNPDGGWKAVQQPKSWQDEEQHLLDDEAFRRILKMCLDALPEKWNLCVKLKYLTGKKGEEICQELDISTTNYWQIIHRAKLQLRDCVENNWFNN